METWEQVLLGIAACAIAFFFWPGVKRALEQSRRAENPDWQGALLPIGIVILFVIALIMLAGA